MEDAGTGIDKSDNTAESLMDICADSRADDHGPHRHRPVVAWLEIINVGAPNTSF